MTERVSTSASSLCVDCVFVCDPVRVVSESAGSESLLHFQLRFGTMFEACPEPRGEGECPQTLAQVLVSLSPPPPLRVVSQP